MATLVIVEVCDGGFDAAEMHLKGVYNLFRLGGGYDSFKDQFILCKSINLADIQVATALGQGLVFPLMQTDQPQLLPTILEHPFDPPLHDSVTSGSHYCSWIFTQLRQLLLATQSSTISVDDQRTLLNIVDYSTLRHLYTGFTDTSYTGRRSRALVLAAQVFMYLTLRQVPPRSPLICRMCDRLRRMMEVDQPGGIWADHGEAMLWVAFIGLLGTEGKWFLHHFKSTVQALQKEIFSGNDGIVGIFSSFLWDEALCPQLLARLEDPGVFNEA
ncbi:hypothetical protein CEP52_003388 [Fusarium oligoseptatum]|uniref:Acriflavine sensitivity control protein acr-2 n=1 Tax=Fusarium oligoseptatum TaxID=2604345 RepID=A0A428U8Z9_9HYPO|nr:hypothetical protein CEP52_003388 [Fusarium oligoseptatum]